MPQKVRRFRTKMNHENGVGLLFRDFGEQRVGRFHGIDDQIAAEEFDVAEFLANRVQARGKNPGNLARSVEFRLGPRAAGSKIDDVNLNRRLLLPCAARSSR